MNWQDTFRIDEANNMNNVQYESEGEIKGVINVVTTKKKYERHGASQSRSPPGWQDGSKVSKGSRYPSRGRKGSTDAKGGFAIFAGADMFANYESQHLASRLIGPKPSDIGEARKVTLLG